MSLVFFFLSPFSKLLISYAPAVVINIVVKMAVLRFSIVIAAVVQHTAASPHKSACPASVPKKDSGLQTKLQQLRWATGPLVLPRLSEEPFCCCWPQASKLSLAFFKKEGIVSDVCLCFAYHFH